jgi:hypothetical protein
MWFQPIGLEALMPTWRDAVGKSLETFGTTAYVVAGKGPPGLLRLRKREGRLYN